MVFSGRFVVFSIIVVMIIVVFGMLVVLKLFSIEVISIIMYCFGVSGILLYCVMNIVYSVGQIVLQLFILMFVFSGIVNELQFLFIFRLWVIECSVIGIVVKLDELMNVICMFGVVFWKNFSGFRLCVSSSVLQIIMMCSVQVMYNVSMKWFSGSSFLNLQLLIRFVIRLKVLIGVIFSMKWVIWIMMLFIWLISLCVLVIFLFSLMMVKFIRLVKKIIGRIESWFVVSMVLLVVLILVLMLDSVQKILVGIMFSSICIMLGILCGMQLLVIVSCRLFVLGCSMVFMFSLMYIVNVVVIMNYRKVWLLSVVIDFCLCSDEIVLMIVKNISGMVIILIRVMYSLLSGLNYVFVVGLSVQLVSVLSMKLLIMCCQNGICSQVEISFIGNLEGKEGMLV